MDRSHQEIIAAALAGSDGCLSFPFRSADRNARTDQMNDTIRRLPLDGLAVRLVLHPDDTRGQPVPVEAEGSFRSFGLDALVRRGEFHLAISRVQ